MFRARVLPRSRKVLALTAGAVPAAPLALAAPAQGAEPGTCASTVTPLRFTVRAGGRSCAIDAGLYRPEGVDAAHPAPAALAPNGFGGSKRDSATGASGR